MSLPLPPNPHAVFVLALTLIALFLLSREKIPLESSSLFILVALSVVFEFFPFTVGDTTFHAIDFFAGFGNEALVAVCALMIAGQGILRTGGLEPMGRVLGRLWKISPTLSPTWGVGASDRSTTPNWMPSCSASSRLLWINSRVSSLESRNVFSRLATPYPSWS